MKNDGYADLIAESLGSTAGVDLYIGQILSWDDATGTNVVRVRGAELANLQTLGSAGLTSLDPGTTVLIGRYRTRWFIIGRIVSQGLATPMIPIMLYPMFAPSQPIAGATGWWTVATGVLASWEGRTRVTHPMIETDGIWGNASGSGSTTYELLIGGQSYGSWTETALRVGRAGPFDVTDRIGQDWLKIEIKITASTGTGLKSIQPLGTYFRQRPPTGI